MTRWVIKEAERDYLVQIVTKCIDQLDAVANTLQRAGCSPRDLWNAEQASASAAALLGWLKTLSTGEEVEHASEETGQ